MAKNNPFGYKEFEPTPRSPPSRYSQLFGQLKSLGRKAMNLLSSFSGLQVTPRRSDAELLSVRASNIADRIASEISKMSQPQNLRLSSSSQQLARSIAEGLRASNISDRNASEISKMSQPQNLRPSSSSQQLGRSIAEGLRASNISDRNASEVSRRSRPQNLRSSFSSEQVARSIAEGLGGRASNISDRNPSEISKMSQPQNNFNARKLADRDASISGSRQSVAVGNGVTARDIAARTPSERN